jgi:prepilin-type N-terminal cleavage/methylation domain-containing protein
VRDRNRNGFTLIELLVVIAIIAILLGLVFPVFQGVLDRAKKVQAKNDLTQVVTAVNAFYTEYGRYPLPSGVNTDKIYGKEGASSSSVFNELRNAGAVTINTRQIVFISPPEDKVQANPKGKIGSDGQFYDPWGTAYNVEIDDDYTNAIETNPYTDTDGSAGATPLRQGVIGWSYGKDQAKGKKGGSTKFKSSDDVISWQ